MSNRFRMLYSNAHYHVMNRGKDHGNIFHDEKDFKKFVSLLRETNEKYNALYLSYCLMSNHYHLLIVTPDANLPLIMKHINSVYAKYYNKRYSKDGALFKGRYKAILIEDSKYLANVSRYIHLNPVVANICSAPEDYRWSSCNIFLSDTTPSIEWILAERVLRKLDTISEESYRDFLSKGLDDKTRCFYEDLKTPLIFGNEMFREKIIREYEVQ